MPLSPKARAVRESRNIVRFLLSQNLTREELKRRISEAASIGEPVRRAALAFAAVVDEELDRDGVSEKTRAVVLRPDARPQDYETALRQAQEALQAGPISHSLPQHPLYRPLLRRQLI